MELKCYLMEKNRLKFNMHWFLLRKLPLTWWPGSFILFILMLPIDGSWLLCEHNTTCRWKLTAFVTYRHISCVGLSGLFIFIPRNFNTRTSPLPLLLDCSPSTSIFIFLIFLFCLLLLWKRSSGQMNIGVSRRLCFAISPLVIMAPNVLERAAMEWALSSWVVRILFLDFALERSGLP